MCYVRNDGNNSNNNRNAYASEKIRMLTNQEARAQREQDDIKKQGDICLIFNH